MKEILNDDSHFEAMCRIAELMDSDQSPVIVEEMKQLSIIIEKYEEARWPIPEPTEEEMKAFRAAQEEQK